MDTYSIDARVVGVTPVAEKLEHNDAEGCSIISRPARGGKEGDGKDSVALRESFTQESLIGPLFTAVHMIHDSHNTQQEPAEGEIQLRFVPKVVRRLLRTKYY